MVEDKELPRGFKGILFKEKEIQDKILELAEKIDQDYQGKELVIIIVLKGAYLFAADLTRKLKAIHTISFITTSTYKGSSVLKEVSIIGELDVNIAGKEVLVVEDIIDTGHTLDKVLAYLKQKNPQSLHVCTLLNKEEKREVEIPIKYCGFEVDKDKWLVGYGFDLNDQYRNLPFLGWVSPDDWR